MGNYDDPVDVVMLAFLDYLDGTAPRPALDHLSDEDRRRAEALMNSLKAGRGIDPHASRPSIEALLAGTRLAGLLPAVHPPTIDATNLTTVRQVISGIDSRARVDIDSGDSGGPTVVYSYLDLRARFLLVRADTPAVTDEVRALVEVLFDSDPDTSRVGVVAVRNDDLLTQVLSADEVGHAITTPRGEPHTRWDPPLPLALAVRRMLEHSAPEWDPVDFDQALSNPLDVTAVAAEIAGQVIGREAARSYRGDKARAYRALAGQEHLFADLVAKVSTPGNEAVDLETETSHIVRRAA